MEKEKYASKYSLSAFKPRKLHSLITPMGKLMNDEVC